MATKPANVKRGDTEVVVALNMDLTGATVAAFLEDETGADFTPGASVRGLPTKGLVAIATAALATGKYKLEVETVGPAGRITFPDVGYFVLNVNRDLGDQ